MSAIKKTTTRKIDENKSVNIFLKINNYNWDYGYQTMENLLKRKDCDHGALLLMYWRTDPHYYLQYASEEEAWDKESWQFIQTVEQALLSGKYPTVINFDPSAEIAKGSPREAENYVRELPSEVYKAAPGKETNIDRHCKKAILTIKPER